MWVVQWFALFWVHTPPWVISVWRLHVLSCGFPLGSLASSHSPEMLIRPTGEVPMCLSVYVGDPSRVYPALTQCQLGLAPSP